MWYACTFPFAWLSVELKEKKKNLEASIEKETAQGV